MKDYKEAAIALLTFKSTTTLLRGIEVSLSVVSWLAILGIFLNIYLLIVT